MVVASINQLKFGLHQNSPEQIRETVRGRSRVMTGGLKNCICYTTFRR
jgi:hypothetical protein